MIQECFTEAEAKEVTDYLLGEGNQLSREADFKLYCHLQPEMPYGVQKARTATPDEWYPEYFANYTERQIRTWVDERSV